MFIPGSFRVLKYDCLGADRLGYSYRAYGKGLLVEGVVSSPSHSGDEKTAVRSLRVGLLSLYIISALYRLMHQNIMSHLVRPLLLSG